MVFDYMVYIKNERGRYINTISILLCLISAAFFLNQQIKVGHHQYFYLASSCLVIAGLAWNRYLVTKRNQVVYYRRMLILAGAAWLYMPFMPWLAVPFIMLALIEKHSKLPLEIGFNPDMVVFNTLIKREYNWSAFTNVMLRDGLLTIDFNNNRLFQKEISDDISSEQEAEFNEYCRGRLANGLATLV